MKNEAKKIVRELYSDKHKVLFYSIFASLLLCAVIIAIAIISGKLFLIAFYTIPLFTFIITACIYGGGRNAMSRSVKTLIRTGKLDYAKEILSGDYSTNGKVCFSAHMLYDKKTNVMVAYEDIVWVYTCVVQNSVEARFCTIDGTYHRSLIDTITLSEFLKRRNGILVGDTPENQKLFKAKVKEFKANNK